MKRRREKQPPPYLDRRFASNSVSTRRSMRTSAGRFMQFFLCVMMLMTFSVQKASAYSSWQDSWISQWYDPVNATIVLDIRVYQSWGGSGDGHCGFIGGSGNLTINVAGYGIKINGPDNTWDKPGDLGKYVKNDKGGKLDEKVAVQWLGSRKVDGDKTAYYLKITVPLTQDRIGTDVPIKYKGTWWRRWDAAEDESVESDRKVDTRYGCTPTKITNAYYGVRGNKPGYVIAWKKDGTATKNSIDKKGHLRLCYSNGDPVPDISTDNPSLYSSGEFFIPVESLNLDNPSEYKIIQHYEPTYNKEVVYETSSANKTRPAYPQVKEISANYDQVTRKIKVDWYLSAAPTQNCIEDNMVLTIKSTDKATDAVETIAQNIKYMAGKTAYSYEFDVPLGKSLDYEFSVRRSHTGTSDVWNNAFSKQTSLSASAKHCNVTAGSVHAVLDEESKTATITWNTEGDIWSSGTKAVLTRLNVTNNTTDNIELSKENFKSGKYVDKMITVCN